MRLKAVVALVRGPVAGRGRRVLGRILPGLAAAGLVGCWWLASVLFSIDPFFLPSPPDIVRAFVAAPGYLLQETAATAAVTLAGFGLATAVGLVVAAVIATSRLVERAVLPILVALHSVPKIAIAPLLVVWLGFGPRPKIALVLAVAFFPIMLAAVAGLTSTPRELADLARSLSASRWQTFVKIRLPWALPQVLVGLKTGGTLAVIGAVVAELSSSSSGLGAVILTAGTTADTPRAFAAVTLLALLSSALFGGLVAVERLALRWAAETTT
ncbi:ABC transporter permease [Plantactinospora sp. B6F1]|uniref:ABC transporter permease subunit n=1 Tax=Plantactinospora sp. B6F1 TaxID=3158971 RepID=UPI00102CB775